MPLDEPARAFVQLGIPRRSAKQVSRILQRDVTGWMRVLLPDVEYSAAPATLVTVRAALISVLPRLAWDLMSGTGLASPDLANSAALPVILLEAVNFELLNQARANIAAFGTAATRRPSPSAPLTQARRLNEQRIATASGGLAAISPQLQAMLGDMLGPLIVQGIPDQETHGKAQEWTGWALLAAMHAMEMHDHVLPVPGRNARDFNASLAEEAFQTGRRITIAAALNLIDRAERHAASGPD